MAVDTVLPSILEFYDNVYALTDYEDKQDADAVWSKMRSDLPGITVHLSQMEILVPSKCLYHTLQKSVLIKPNVINKMVMALFISYNH